MYFTIDRFWDILSAISSNAETVAEGDALTDVLDSLALDAKAKASNYFDAVMGGYPPSRESDWVRLRSFLLDWYAAHQTIASSTSQITDPRTLSNPDLDELFRSFGYPYSTQLRGPDDNPTDLKVNFFLDLVNLYKRKGTPQSIVEVLQYYGVTNLNIYEFFIERSSASSLIFKGKAVAGTETNPSDLLFDYERLTSGDPHWLYTESQILSLYNQNDINLPSKTPYLGVQPIASIDGAEIGILIRIVQDQYEYYLTNGTLPTANAEISETGEVVTLLELYLSIIYIFQKQFSVGLVGDSFICYDGTNNVLTEVTEIINEFETITARPTTRAGILTGLEQFYDTFSRETPRNFLQNVSDAETILTLINPTLKTDLDNTTLTNSELLFSLVKDLSSWVRINLGYGFVNMGFIMFGLDSFFQDLKPVINFFKPYRARLLLLELLKIDNPLFNTIIVEDDFDPVNVEFPIYDFITGNGNPCCTLGYDLDSTSCCLVCVDSTSPLYYARDTYDCGSYHDLGAVTDILQNDFFPEIHEIRHISLVCIPPDLDSTAIVSNEVLYGSMSAVFDGTAWTSVIDTTGFISYQGKIYEELTTGGFAAFDEPGVFDCPTGFDEVFVQVYYESSSSSSSVSSSSSSLSSSSLSSSSLSSSSSSLSTVPPLTPTTGYIYGTSGNINTARQVATAQSSGGDTFYCWFYQLGDWRFIRSPLVWDLSGEAGTVTSATFKAWTGSSPVGWGSYGIVLVEGKTGWEGEGGAGGNLADNYSTWYWPGPGLETYWATTALTDIVNEGSGSTPNFECTWTFNASGLALINSKIGTANWLELYMVAERDRGNQSSDSCNMSFRSEIYGVPSLRPVLNLTYA